MKVRSHAARLVILSSALCAICLSVAAQTARQPQPAASPQPTPAQPMTQTQPTRPATQTAAPDQTPAANPADVATTDSIIAALYDVISGPAGQARDWDRMRSLFAPSGRMVPVVPRQGGGFAAVTMSPDDYVQRSGEMLTRFGFTEREMARRM